MDRLLGAYGRHASHMDSRAAHPRCALVTSVDADGHTVRVTIQPEGVLSGWIPVPAVGVGGVSIVSPPSVGDQVVVVFQEGDHEHPLVMGRLFSSVDKPPTSPISGKAIGADELGIFGGGGAFLHLTGDGIWHFKGPVKIDGDVEITGKLTTTGIIKSLEDVVAKVVSLFSHTHSGVKSGGGSSGGPNQ